MANPSLTPSPASEQELLSVDNVFGFAVVWVRASGARQILAACTSAEACDVLVDHYEEMLDYETEAFMRVPVPQSRTQLQWQRCGGNHGIREEDR